MQLDDWVSRIADEVIAEAQRLGSPVVCASGLSPSGPIHLGNLREVMTPHLVADEVRRRGIAADHLISWDDYDRFRRVPAGLDGVDESWAEHIGKPLTSVPPPHGSPHRSWAAHFRAQCEESLNELGIDYRSISQTEQYTSGAYTEQILFAMEHRAQIDKVLDQYRTLDAAAAAGAKPGNGGTPGKGGKPAPKLSEDEAAAAAAAAEGSGAAAEDDGSADGGYYPYKPYCTVCGRDTTTVTGYDDATTELSYSCACGHSETVLLKDFRHGKLVWKVDWPMRWAYEKVIFEPSGVDHQSPGSSFEVGKDLAPLFGWQRPIGPMYAFVGIKGMAKMSSSRGRVPVPADALQIMEPALVRWLYARRRPNQSFDIAFDAEIQRLYDEWDALQRRVSEGAAGPAEYAAQVRASSVADRSLPVTPHPISYRTLASIVDITTGDEDQLLRIVGQLDPKDPVSSVDELRPRLDCVEHWVATRMAAEDRTVVRTGPATELLAAATDEQRESLRMLLDGNGSELSAVEDGWTLEGLTHQVYGVPKVQRGFAADQIVKGDKELSAAQRTFFVLLYRLLIDKDTGPRLPTLLLAIGPERVRALLTP
ncbi:lysine--tRNA ligase [Nakamurella lactea]|uniref:lysine--tRNA ligase n=1 Tax=Nakamurella lactea TaxID=459515 RepID=UPI0005607469|nr:lysine--tRNA ligase [Nakamurella lactea]